jgi:hypothetical protein
VGMPNKSVVLSACTCAVPDFLCPHTLNTSSAIMHLLMMTNVRASANCVCSLLVPAVGIAAFIVALVAPQAQGIAPCGIESWMATYVVAVLSRAQLRKGRVQRLLVTVAT